MSNQTEPVMLQAAYKHISKYIHILDELQPDTEDILMIIIVLFVLGGIGIQDFWLGS